MTTTDISIPSPETQDIPDVRAALQTAEATHSRGDSEEALRWVRRAAERAGSAGDDLRAVTLAKAAAEIQAHLPSGAAASSNDVPSSAVPSNEGNAQEPGEKQNSRPPPLPGPASAATSAPAANPSAPSPASAQPPDARTFEAALSTPPPSEAASPSAVGATPTAAGLDGSQAGATTEAGAANADPKPVEVTPPRPESTAPPASTARPRKPFERAALRVYVIKDGTKGDQLDVRVLREGDPPPAGAIKALLVPLQRGQRLVG